MPHMNRRVASNVVVAATTEPTPDVRVMAFGTRPLITNQIAMADSTPVTIRPW